MHRKYLVKDSIGATIAVFLVMGLFAYFPFNTHILDPLKHGLKDFEFSDIYYSKIKQKAGVDTNIIIVNIGYNNRYQLAEQLQIIARQQPAVIGFDVLLRSHKDPFIDSLLATTINNTPNMVMASYITGGGHGEEEHFDTDSTALPLKNKNWGFINFIGEDEESPVRFFLPDFKDTRQPQESFAAAVVKQYSPQAYEALKKRNKETEQINYSRTQEEYHVVDAYELMDTTADLGYMRGKIVLLGFMGPDLQTKVLEENRFTPLNPKFSGKSYPDMYGIVIHANIISMILEGAYINKVPYGLTLLIAFIICWLHIIFFIRYYVRHHKFYHLVTKLVQLLTFVLMVYVSFWLLGMGIKMEMGALLGAIALSVDVLYFYDGFVTWLHEKTGYKTVFGHH